MVPLHLLSAIAPPAFRPSGTSGISRDDDFAQILRPAKVTAPPSGTHGETASDPATPDADATDEDVTADDVAAAAIPVPDTPDVPASASRMPAGAAELIGDQAPGATGQGASMPETGSPKPAEVSSRGDSAARLFLALAGPIVSDSPGSKLPGPRRTDVDGARGADAPAPEGSAEPGSDTGVAASLMGEPAARPSRGLALASGMRGPGTAETGLPGDPPQGQFAGLLPRAPGISVDRGEAASRQSVAFGDAAETGPAAAAPAGTAMARTVAPARLGDAALSTRDHGREVSETGTASPRAADVAPLPAPSAVQGQVSAGMFPEVAAAVRPAPGDPASPAPTLAAVPSRSTGAQGIAQPVTTADAGRDSSQVVLPERVAALAVPDAPPIAPELTQSVPLIVPAASGHPAVAEVPGRGMGSGDARPVLAQLALAIERIEEGGTEIRLDPAELGRVKLQVQSTETAVTLSITVERPETADLIRRNLDLLAQDLRALGFEDVGLSLSGEGAQDRPQPGPHSAARAVPAVPAADGLAATMPPPRPVLSRGGLDLRL